MRNNLWLKNKLVSIWQKYFFDIKQENPVVIKFSRPSKYRFGSIRQIKKRKIGFYMPAKKMISKILINGMFASYAVPVEVIEYTIAHEISHYSHGFSSDLPQSHRYPHQGRVVEKELIARGMDKQVKSYKNWLKQYREKLKADLN